jgi:hypothetical protein
VQISGKTCGGDPGNDYTSAQERKHEPYTESLNSPRSKKARQVKSNVKSMFVISVGIKGIVHKELIQADLAVRQHQSWKPWLALCTTICGSII